MEERPVQEWKTHIIPALYSKQNEFRLIGYQEVTTEEIWKCLTEKVWKGNPKKRLHEITKDIFHLSTSTYMSYMTVNALQVEDDDLMNSIQVLTSPQQERNKIGKREEFLNEKKR